MRIGLWRAPGLPRAKLRGQHFLSKEKQQQYLERARGELREEASNAQEKTPPVIERGKRIEPSWRMARK